MSDVQAMNDKRDRVPLAKVFRRMLLLPAAVAAAGLVGGPLPAGAWWGLGPPSNLPDPVSGAYILFKPNPVNLGLGQTEGVTTIEWDFCPPNPPRPDLAGDCPWGRDHKVQLEVREKPGGEWMVREFSREVRGRRQVTVRDGQTLDAFFIARADGVRTSNLGGRVTTERVTRVEDAPGIPRIATTVGRGNTQRSTGAPEFSICERAAAARDRNSPAAAALAEKCRASGGQVPTGPLADLDALAQKGAGMIAADALAAELRESLPEGGARYGFDIGIAASEGHSEWGPSKERIRDAFPPAEREGFVTAVSFNIDRNRYAERVRIGAGIAADDAELEELRRKEADVRYRLGFDIASAIFGDPAKGAQGNTAMGPGAQGIRNMLSAPAQRGFDASVKLHLGRQY